MIFGLNIIGIILGISFLALAACLIIVGRKAINNRMISIIGDKCIKGKSATLVGAVLLVFGGLLLITALLFPLIML